MKPESEIIKTIAYIQDGNVFFQILNEAQDDWDEAATNAAYQQWLSEQQ